MRKIILSLAVLAGLLAPVTVAGAASANSAPLYNLGGSVSLTVSNARYAAGGDCVDNPVTVKINVPDDYAYMDFDYESTYDGPTDWADFVSANEVWSGTYHHSFLLCPTFDHPGSYTATLDVTFYDADYNVIDYAHATDAFTVGWHTTTMSTSKVKSGAHGWTLRTVNRHDGRAWAGHRVTLQRKYNGSWHTVKSVYTNSLGRANLSVTPPRGAAKPYRAVSTAGHGATAKVSPTYWLKRR